MNQVRIGVIGCGYMGRLHAQKLAEIPEANLVCVVDEEWNRAMEVGAEVGAPAYKSIAEMIPLVDAVTIATPTNTHITLAMMSIGAGLDVFIEKPICETLEDAESIVMIAEDTGRIVQVGHLQRFHPAIIYLEQIVDNPMYIETRRLTEYRDRGGDVSVIMDLMIHDIDIALMLIKSKVADVRTAGICVITGNCDLANARIEFENGAVLNAMASRVSSQDVRMMKIYQRSMTAEIDYIEDKIRVGGFEDKPKEIKFKNGDPLMDELEAFVMCCITRQKPPVTASKGRDALKIALALNA